MRIVYRITEEDYMGAHAPSRRMKRPDTDEHPVGSCRGWEAASC